MITDQYWNVSSTINDATNKQCQIWWFCEEIRYTDSFQSFLSESRNGLGYVDEGLFSTMHIN